MAESGCVECGANTYSGDAATECTSCTEGKVSAVGSTSEADCQYGSYYILKSWVVLLGISKDITIPSLLFTIIRQLLV